ncbi:mediator of RNA polymerase II transcription subunit 12 [Cynara cardunculus var. scolymus]|uniref:mediator of RNA polymerase II transcription subunit 12 n=1 Tax=Cynara cardunculus var. scolymus TaxID=59895 RepID=UPI000D6283EE|nr:mediator of RNA polymerase II transcription subunit 12 [Cynara cardunculus var. scolymus]XP_024996019.1 mediator of RNA polymerase II transcription subunit 12 [Cynara cardunculus var. scolymus]
MQRYHATNCTSAVNNSAVGGSLGRDTSRAESSALPANFPLNRRPSQLAPYKLRCEKDPLNSRLPPPDFHPPTTNCPEETLTKDYVLGGYRETVEGLEESREITLSQIPTFTKPVIIKCKEAIRKYHRAINESRAQKRKAGQVYGVPLAGNLLSKSGVFPEQKATGEDFRKKWIEGLSQQHKRLRSLADHVPQGYRRKSPFEVLIRNNVPLLRATWFIKVTYLNLVRPGSSSTSSGSLDKTRFSRSDQWTKDVIEYLQYLLDEFVSKNNSHSTMHSKDRSPQFAYAGSMQHKSDSVMALVDGEEPSLHFKWWYVVRIIQWHHAEGLLLPSLIIDWVLNQLQEKELLGILQLLLPIIYGVIETIVLSQNYVRTLVGIAVRFIQEPSPGGSDLVDNSRRAYTISAMVEILRYLILAVPDTFVALNCFPLPSCVVSSAANDGSLITRVSGEGGKLKGGSLEAACMLNDKGLEVQGRSLSIDSVVSSIQKCAVNLARAASPGHPGHNVAKAANELDRALIHGDITIAYKCMFEDFCDEAVDKRWIAEVSSYLRSSLKWLGAMRSSFVCSIFFVCEWATCDFRDFRTSPPHGVKFSGKRDFSQIYVATRLLEMKMRNMRSSRKSGRTSAVDVSMKHHGLANNIEVESKSKVAHKKIKDLSQFFQSPGPLHDIIVCWLDQHQTQNGEGFKRVQLLITELIRSGIFYPQAYVRELIVSGIMGKNDSMVDMDRRRRHYKLLKHLPGPYIQDALEEAQIAEVSLISEAMHIYSNERRLLLHELLDHPKNIIIANSSLQKQKNHQKFGKDGSLAPSRDQWKIPSPASDSLSSKNVNRTSKLEELMTSISVLLHFPNSNSTTAGNGFDESQAVKRPIGPMVIRSDPGEGTPGCEECRRAKRQKVIEEKSPYLQGQSLNLSDDEDIWWVRKGLKSLESFRADPPIKPVKQASRGRQKIVRKTQSLAQLAAARIEGSQGASTSHVCDSRVSCPHHRNGSDNDVPKTTDSVKTSHSGDISSIGKILKRMPLDEKRAIVVWLMGIVKQLVDEAGKITETVPKVGQYGRSFPPVDDRGLARWKLGEDELSTILYLMDVCDDLVNAARFLVWLLPKVPINPIPTVHGGRNVMIVPRNVENQLCAVAEAYILSSLRRYENILAAADLIPETLSAMMHRASVVMASNGRVSGSAALVFSRQMLKKYGHVVSVVEWVKNFKSTSDKRLVMELESGRSSDGEFGFPLGVPAGVQDFDEFLRQKISGVRISRVGLGMRDTVQRLVDEAIPSFYGQDKKSFAGGSMKRGTVEKSDDGYQIAQQVVKGLLDCMRQTGGAAQEGDPTLVAFAVSAIVSNVGQVIAKIPDITANTTASSLNFAKQILRIHLTSLSLLKDALGERQSRVFEIALATEASSALAQVFSPAKASRGQLQLSPESRDSNAIDNPNSAGKTTFSKAAKTTGAISALVVGAVLQGIASLERMVTVFRLKEGLNVIQYVRSTRSNSNGNVRSIGDLKMDSLVEVSVHWFRVLVGNCRSVSEGFIVELLGESSIVALSRIQRMLPINLVFPPAFAIFGFLVWRRFILNASVVPRDNIPQLFQSLTLAIGDAIKHLPFRDVCLRECATLYDIVAADSTDSEFAMMLDLNGPDPHSKLTAFVPLRARIFLNAIIDCQLPLEIVNQDDGNWASGHSELKALHVENETKLLDKLVHILDTLQPAKFHWQWVELRLLLNEQAVIEKVDSRDISLAEALRSFSPNNDNGGTSENENNFIQMVLTRLLVRPDAAPLFSEVVHLLGRSLEDEVLLQAKWFLRGHDVLFGRKSIRQRLINIAESKGLSTKTQFWKPWGWCIPSSEGPARKGIKRKFEMASLEEGEVVDDGTDSKRHSRTFTPVSDVEAFIVGQQHVTEKALVELLLPCIDQSSDDSRITFASDLIKQMNEIEQQISTVTHGGAKQAGTVASGIEGPVSKVNTRKGMRGGSPGLARRPATPVELMLPSPSALRASMSLRLQLLLRLLPVICADGESSVRNMRHMLASVVLRLLGSRVVNEDADLSNPASRFSVKREVESMIESSATVDLGESLFDRLLLVLHALLSSSQPYWLRSKFPSKSTAEGTRDSTLYDREVAESLQNELDGMQLPDTIRWRIQTAMPFVFPSVRFSISCQPPSVPLSAISSLQPPTISVPGPHLRSNPSRTTSNGPGKATKPVFSSQPDSDMEIDPWTLLEDGAGSGPSSINAAAIAGSDHANLKASSWLKGAVRVRRMDLTYIGAIDDDS